MGKNHCEHAFLDEALAEVSPLIYFECQYGEEAAAEQFRLNVAPFIGAYPADSQSVAYPDDVASFEAVYGKGSLAFYTLREHL